MLEITTDQKKIIDDPSRYKVIVAGRRWGKTHLALFDALIKLWKRKKQKIWFVSPTYRQSKNIAWAILKEICFEHPRLIKTKNEAELYIEFVNNSRIELKGADNEDSLRGVGLSHVILDEFAFMKKEAWTEVLRPALSDKKGSALFIGTPDGFNYFYDLYQQGNNQENGFRSWHFKSIDSPYIDEKEIEAARDELDERTFRQEYEATFETASGRVYYAFDRGENIKDIKYNDDLQIKLLVDFNVSPMSWLILQTIKGEDFVVDEIVRNNTNTEEMSTVISELYGQDKHYIVYGDFAGTYKSTKSRSTDYDIMKEILPNSEFNLQPNPIVVDRVNAVNARLKNAKNERRLFVNPKCKELVKDLEQVVWKEGKREIDKSNIERTHCSDALGYYIHYNYPLRGKPTVTHKW